MQKSAQVVDVYPYCKEKKEIKFLMLKRSDNKTYAGQWRMVGGKIKSEESAWEAGLRELLEETTLKPELYWAVPSINHFYDHSTDSIHLIPAFAAEISPSEIDNIRLDDEHTEAQWISAKKCCKIIHWPEQRRLIKLIERIILRDELLDEWIIKVSKS